MITDLAAVISRLTQPYTHTERVRTGWDHNRHPIYGTHTTKHPGLLAQLRLIYDAAPIGDDNGGPSTPLGSRPPLAIDALSLHIAIAGAINRWSRSLELPYQSTIEAQACGLVGAAPHLDHDTLRTLLDEARTWQRRADILTGWTSPPYAPRIPCMADGCTARSGLRLHADTRTGMCTTCGATWTDQDGGFSRLVEHVRTNAAAKAA